ncbi:MAG: amidohydrolase [Clostridia bacterium]|nr:amidohydrolase [Clostridia bacterium]
MLKEKKFFDIHCHAMNLSHPYFLSFIKQFNIPLLLAANSLFGPLSSFIIGKKINKVENLMSVMENDVGNIFFLMESCIKNCQPPLVRNGKVNIGGNEYSKIVLTPLLIDFGYKGMASAAIHYNEPSHKPVVEQVIDVFNGIKAYKEKYENGGNLFEIFPFLGINTQNYPLGKETTEKVGSEPPLHFLPRELQRKVLYRKKSGKLVFRGEMRPDEKNALAELFIRSEDKNAVERLFKNSQDLKKRNTIPKMLEKYFAQYHRNPNELLSKMGAFDGNIENLTSNFFSGIKVYPPLGFDPWPEGDKEELRKVKYLYRYCCKKKIPITAHCNESGFVVLNKKQVQTYTSPDQWEKVLKRYPELKLNLAHMGRQNKFLGILNMHQWSRKALKLALKYENVYIDFSCRGDEDKFYKLLKKLIAEFPEKQREKLMKRILFGSDFSINLMWCSSYNEYMNCFSNTPVLSPQEKDLFGSMNPEKFLFD